MLPKGSRVIRAQKSLHAGEGENTTGHCLTYKRRMVLRKPETIRTGRGPILRQKSRIHLFTYAPPRRHRHRPTCTRLVLRHTRGPVIGQRLNLVRVRGVRVFLMTVSSKTNPFECLSVWSRTSPWAIERRITVTSPRWISQSCGAGACARWPAPPRSTLVPIAPSARLFTRRRCGGITCRRSIRTSCTVRRKTDRWTSSAKSCAPRPGREGTYTKQRDTRRETRRFVPCISQGAR